MGLRRCRRTRSTHTLIASDKLVFNNQLTYVARRVLPRLPGRATAATAATRASDPARLHDAAPRADASCLWNTQALINRTHRRQQPRAARLVPDDAADVGRQDGRHLLPDPHARRRPQPEVRPRLPQGADPDVLALQRRRAARSCSASATRQPAAATARTWRRLADGIVPYEAVLYRDLLREQRLVEYNGYIQDSYSRGRFRLNGGLRYDWQKSKYLGGCVPANAIRPDLLPSQCEDATRGRIGATARRSRRSATGRRALSVTYDLFGNGKTSGARERARTTTTPRSRWRTRSAGSPRQPF